MLLTDRRRALAMRDREEEPNPAQGALFAPDAVTPARGPTPDPFAPPHREPAAAVADADTPVDLVTPSEVVPAPGDTDATAGVPVPNELAGPADLVALDETIAPGRATDSAEPVSAADYAVAPDDVDDPMGLVAPEDFDAPTDLVAAPDDLDVPAQAAPGRADATPRRRAAALAGPTLDDVVTRVWEGMRAQVPTACPVCHSEIEPALDGRCGSCGSALD